MPLPVGKARTFSSAPKAKKRKTSGYVEGYGADDTPKAFARLMAFSNGTKPRRSGLDDGLVKTKKQKKAEQVAALAQSSTAQPDTDAIPQRPSAKVETALKIQPGESLSAFRSRVDAALPLTGITRSSKKIAGMPDHRVTKHERKLKRLQKGWREEEARIRAKEEEAAELAEEDNDEMDAMWEDKSTDLPSTTTGKKRSKKTKRKKVVGEIDNGSEDEWDILQRSKSVQKGLHDVVSAPPVFTKVPREVFKVRDGAGAKVGNVPSKAGSLRMREVLGEERGRVVEGYRNMMGKRKAR